MPTFNELYERATGYEPYGYQARIARDGLPSVVRAPTGTGKTGVILAWLWRRLYGPHPAETPRRLVYALPQRSLLDQVAGEARRWLANLGLTENVALHVVMGSREETQGEWRANMHLPAIVIGTVDSLVSKALNRGYGIGRATFPIDFALVTNGAHWIIDEFQLCPESTRTLQQLAAFTAKLGTAEPFGVTWMSATLPDGLLTTADNTAAGKPVGILPGERTGELAVRLGAKRTVRRLEAEPGDYRKIAAAIRELHRPDMLTLVVLNTVQAAREVYKQLRGAAAGRTLLHSRFRRIERAPLMAGVAAGPHDRIVVATQVIEAGIDLNAAVLVTEAAPWPALVQRVGRCNRTGLMNSGAEVWWIPPPTPAPYEQADIDATSADLDLLEGERVTGEALLERAVFTMPQQAAVVRRSDFIGFFDTSTDLSGADADIARYVRDAEDLDAEIAWASWTPGAGGAPDHEVKAPPAEYRCRVPLRDVAGLATKDRAVWRRDQEAGKWVTITAPGQSCARPGEVLLVNAADGGYDPETGFDLSACGPVDGSPELHTVASVEHERGWRSLDQHSAEVRAQADALLRVLAPGLPAGAAESAIVAGYLHDAGKAHETWQDALCALAPAKERGQVASGRPWAKSGARHGRLMFKDDVAFRHELASLLLIDGPLNDLLAKAPDRDLARYLVLAHHGRLRVQVRDHGDLAVPPEREAAAEKILGLEHGTTTNVPAMLGQPATTLTVDLSQFGPGAAWTRTALGLRDKYGPFVLAYLETLVRVADWRASGGKDLPA
jgi:CRISPR-associated endonuclease/helicase Cas3